MRLAHSLATVSIVGFALGCADGSPTSTLEPPAAQTNLATGQLTASATAGLHWTIPASAFGFPVDNRLTISALRQSGGEVEGRFVYEQAFLGNTFVFKGPITCIGVYDGFRAKTGGPVEQSNDPDVPVGTFIWWHVHDNGEGSAAPPDQATLPGLGNEAGNEAFCASANLPLGRLWDTQGNAQVGGPAAATP
jgi:hypothetical protein